MKKIYEKIINLLIILFVLFVLGYGYMLAHASYYSSKNNFQNVSNKNKNNFQNLLLKPVPFFNNALYSVPGTKGNPNFLYNNSYLPFESKTPSIDVLRANKTESIPEYQKQK